LVKVLLYHMIKDTSYGKLIFDLNGEYVLRSTEAKTYGLADINEENVRANLVVYSDKAIPDFYERSESTFDYKGKVEIDMINNLTVGDILNFGSGFSDVMKQFLLYLDEEGVTDFIKNIKQFVKEPQELHKKYPDFFKETDKSAGKTIAAINKRVQPLI